MVNKVILIGRLGSKPELKTTTNGVEHCSLNLALSSKRKQADGSYVEHTDWVYVRVYRKTAENCAKYLDKGRQVYIEGKVRPYSTEDESGKKKYQLDIIADTVQFIGTAAKKETQESDVGFASDFADSSIPF